MIQSSAADSTLRKCGTPPMVSRWNRAPDRASSGCTGVDAVAPARSSAADSATHGSRTAAWTSGDTARLPSDGPVRGAAAERGEQPLLAVRAVGHGCPRPDGPGLAIAVLPRREPLLDRGREGVLEDQVRADGRGQVPAVDEVVRGELPEVLV